MSKISRQIENVEMLAQSWLIVSPGDTWNLYGGQVDVSVGGEVVSPSFFDS